MIKDDPYFGARYYDSDVSVWLSVDPMSDERLWISPYNYVQWNPLNRIDPRGMLDWEPVGDGKWKAEKGDGAETLAKDAGISREKAYRVMEGQGHGTYKDDDGVVKSDVDPGDVVNVSNGDKNNGDKNSGQKKESRNNENHTSTPGSKTNNSDDFEFSKDVELELTEEQQERFDNIQSITEKEKHVYIMEQQQKQLDQLKQEKQKLYRELAKIQKRQRVALRIMIRTGAFFIPNINVDVEPWLNENIPIEGPPLQ